MSVRRRVACRYVTAAIGAKGILPQPDHDDLLQLPGARIRVRLDGGFAHPDQL